MAQTKEKVFSWPHGKRFWVPVFSVWIVMMFTDFLFHGIFLAPLYQQTAQFWRASDEIQRMMPWMWVSQFMFSLAFVWIYLQGLSKANLWTQAFRYAFAILLVAKFPEQLGAWAMAPYPAELVLWWLVIAIVQALAASFCLTWTYQKVQKAWKS